MMPPTHAILEAVPALLTKVFFTALWQGTATVLATEAVLKVLPRAGARMRYTVLSAAFMLLTVLPWVHLSLIAPAREGPSLRVIPMAAMGIALVWGAAAAMRAVQLLLAYRHLRSVARRAVPLESGIAELESLASGTRRVVLCTSADVDAPTVLGFRSPRLLLPAWLAPTLADTDLKQIALHECEHLRRRDDWMNLLQQVALLLLPLHPALHWLDRRLNSERELACDAAVITRTAAPIVYANCLTRLAEQRLERRRRMRLALAAWERRSELTKRVHALLCTAVTWTPQQSRCATGALLVVFAAGSITMARVPQVIRIAGVDLPQLAHASTPVPPLMAASHAVSFQPAVYRGGQPALVTAGFREPVTRATHPRQPAVAVSARSARRRRPTPQLKTLLANAPERSQQPILDRPVRFIMTDVAHTYAAVPFGDGWLFLQL